MSDERIDRSRADALLALHQPGNPVVLPTVWDAWSAQLAVDAGFAALTVGSHPVADSVGKPDGEGMSFDDVLTRVAQITAAVDVPISVDIESGYGEAAAAADRRAAVGRCGRAQHRGHRAQEGKRLRSAEEHAALVGALRTAADAAGVHVVINARTDLFLRQDGDESRPGRSGDRAAEAGRRRRRRLPVSGGSARPGYVMRRLTSSCRCRSTRSRCRTRTTRVVRPARRGPDQLRAVLAGRAGGAGEGDPGALGLA